MRRLAERPANLALFLRSLGSSVMIAILGTGKMGEALLSGLLRAGRPPAEVAVVVRRPARGEELRAGVRGSGADRAEEAAKDASTLVIAVKPQDMGRMLDEIAGLVSASQLVISIAAGITTSFIERRFPVEVPVVRVMSNTPVLVDEAMSVISAGSFAAEAHLRHAEELLAPGRQGAADPRVAAGRGDGAVRFSGPAYVYYLVEAMVDAGILLGMPRQDRAGDGDPGGVRRGDDAADSGEHPVILREAVTSPGGTTIAAIRELEKHGVRAAFLAAIEAARDRGRELGGA